MIRRLFGFLLTLVVPLAALAAGEPRPLTVGCDANYPPYEYLDAQGHPVGFNVDLVRDLAREAGLAVEIRSGAFGDIRRDFEAGRIDLLAGWSSSPERAKTNLFTVPHTRISWSLFVREDGPRVKDLEGLRGLTILAQRGDANYDFFRASNHKVVGVATPEEAFQGLLLGRGDCAVVNKVVGLFILNRDGIKGIKRLDVPFPSLKYGIALHKGQEDLLGRLNEAIFTLEQSGRLQELKELHFGRLEKPELSLAEVSRRAAVVLVPVVLLLLIVLAWSWTLKGQVRKRTLALRQELMERRRAERALQEKSEELRRYFESSLDLLCIADTQGNFVRVNPEWEKILGYRVEELEGRSYLEFVHPDDQAATRGIVSSLASGQAVFSFENRYRRKDGTYRWIEWRSRPSEGNVYAAARDITERKRAAEENARLQDQLLHSQKMESLGRMAGGVAHDMNNVLAAVLGLASASLGQAPPGSALEHTFQTIIKAAERGGKVVKSLLGFARQTRTEEQLLELNEILREEAGLLERTALAKVRIEMDLAEGLHPVLGDASAISHAIMNVCMNAADAMPSGGLLSLATRNVDEGWVELRVRDNGVGMPPEVLEKAMEPFFTTKEVGKGTGLGLALVYSTMKAHKGRVEIQSEPGKGTCVTLRFPATGTRPQVHEGGQEAAADPTPPGLSVMLVDDDELIQASVGALLEVLGHRVHGVLSGEEALAALSTGPRPDLVILDMNMPGLGGQGTFPRLRASWPGLPVILATGRADQAALDLVAGDARAKLLAKPFTMKELDGSLREMLEAG